MEVISNPRVSSRTMFRPVSRAFTLIELVVVLVVLGILASLSVATLVAVEQSGENTVAQVNLQVVAGEASSYYSNNGQFPTYTQFPSIDSAYSFVDGSNPSGVSQSVDTISVYDHILNSEPVLTLTVLSQSGTCFELTEAAPNSPTANAYMTDTPASCYASNPTSSSTGSEW
jgi:general secretion pathway protein G